MTGMTGMTGITFKPGGYGTGANYVLNDLVTHQSKTYICIQANGAGAGAGGIHQPHNSPTYWELAAEMGSTGPTGAIGMTGATGKTGMTGDVRYTIHGLSKLPSHINNIVVFGEHDARDFYITGNDVTINFDSGAFRTGQVNIMRICHSGIQSDPNHPDWITNEPFKWGTGIQWPHNSPPTFPQFIGRSIMCTFVRFNDKPFGVNSKPVYLGTYSPNYYI